MFAPSSNPSRSLKALIASRVQSRLSISLVVVPESHDIIHKGVCLKVKSLCSSFSASQTRASESYTEARLILNRAPST